MSCGGTGPAGWSWWERYASHWQHAQVGVLSKQSLLGDVENRFASGKQSISCPFGTVL